MRAIAPARGKGEICRFPSIGAPATPQYQGCPAGVMGSDISFVGSIADTILLPGGFLVGATCRRNSKRLLLL